MQSHRLPSSNRELPQLLAAFDPEKNVVIWAIDDTPMYSCDEYMDGTNWFSVWIQGDVIHCQATQWYSSRGDFCLRVTDLTPDQAVAMASQAATIASNYYEGDIKLEKTNDT